MKALTNKYLYLLLLLFLFMPRLTMAAELVIEPHALSFFPDADKIGAFEGEPPAAAVYGDNKLLGYVFLTDDVVSIPAYSGKPVTTLVGFDLQGTITGIKILRHEEPILAVGIKESDLIAYVNQYKGIRMTEKAKIGGRDRAGYVALDGISGATITVMVINASIMRSLHKVLESRGIRPDGSSASAPSKESADKGQEPSEEPVWEAVWHDNALEVIILLCSLVVLGFILVFQDWFARHPYLLTYVRNFFLVYTLFFIGWYMLGQLSVVNVLTFFRAAMHEFQWDTFLVDPISFLLWGFVAVTLLLWGRGVYCGWLCPFGALQELLNKLAVRLKVRQLEFPTIIHERLLALKYIIFIMLFGLSLQSLQVVLPYIDVEPFKTAITLRFDREWPYLSYALALLLISLFNRKFYCKYLCPLGAALAIPSRLKLFDWLRRRKECGRPCQICAEECEVRAIRPTGEIDANECHYCLDCQVTYWNTYKCPPLVEKRKRLERHQQRREVSVSPPGNAGTTE
jgi:polyferredoxin